MHSFEQTEKNFPLPLRSFRFLGAQLGDEWCQFRICYGSALVFVISEFHRDRLCHSKFPRKKNSRTPESRENVFSSRKICSESVDMARKITLSTCVYHRLPIGQCHIYTALFGSPQFKLINFCCCRFWRINRNRFILHKLKSMRWR